MAMAASEAAALRSSVNKQIEPDLCAALAAN
jgi:hypothetical protein